LKKKRQFRLSLFLFFIKFVFFLLTNEKGIGISHPGRFPVGLLGSGGAVVR
jgi:hypothetical protein